MILSICAGAGVLRVIALGEFSLAEAERTFLEMLEAVARHQTAKILFDGRALQDRETWRALALILKREVAALKRRAGMRDQRITAVLPKLSARQVLEFLDELTKADRRIARTILHAAVNASDPLTAGRRYLFEYRLVAQRLKAIDPSMARTVAAATFAANVPLDKAMEHMQRFTSLVTKHQERPEMARMIARACYRVK